MAAPVDLAYCMSLEPAEAVAYLQGKGYAISWDWEDVWQGAQAKAFTVAKVTRLDILEDIRQAVQAALDGGLTERWFEKELTETLRAKGWWGRRLMTNPDTGAEEVVQLGSARRLKIIFRTNLQTAYMAGRHAEQLANADDRPYWQYVAILDRRTRPTHRALHGRVFRFDDPVWRAFYPPNGWGCRCRVTTLTAGEMRDGKIKPDTSIGRLGSRDVPVGRSGEVRPVATLVLPDPDDRRKQITVATDPGWSYNPGAAANRPGPYGGDLAALARDELR
ncbi:MAG: minor capsid protein [Alphaproteobacteria bacterium]|jgi:SPP1 gp7 family putative phage head morphogenesis protein|nr:minor capsid protein [Alphaproteobacteria bacterium]